MDSFMSDDFDFDLDQILDAEDAAEEQSLEVDVEEVEEKAPKPKAKPKAAAPVEEEQDEDDEFKFDAVETEESTEGEEEEETETDDQEESDDSPDGESAGDKSSSSVISTFASALFEEGAFPDITEDELKEVKDVKSLIELNLKQIKANEYRDLTPLQKEALEKFRNGFSPEEFVSMKAPQLEYEAIQESDLSDIDKAKKVVKDYLKLTNTPEEAANDLIESYEIDEKLSDKAKLMLPKIKKALQDQEKYIEESRKKEREEQVSKIQSEINKTKEIFEGVSVTEKDRKELFEQMSKPVKVLEDGTPLDAVMYKRYQDPTGFMIKLHYYTKMGLFDEKVNVDFLKTKAKTNAVKKLEEALNKGNSSSKPSGRVRTNDDFDFDDIPDIKVKY